MSGIVLRDWSKRTVRDSVVRRKHPLCRVPRSDLDPHSIYVTFLDAGNFDPFAAMDVLRNVEFDGRVLHNHVSVIEGVSEWRHRSRAYEADYIHYLVGGCQRFRGDPANRLVVLS